MKNVFMFLASVACAGPVFGQATSTDDAEDVKATLIAMWDAIEHGDLNQYASFIHADFTAFGESDAYLSSGKSYEVRSVGEFLKRAKNVHTEMHQPKIVVRDEVAWITYYWTDAGVVDGERFTSRGKSTRIFVKEGGHNTRAVLTRRG